MQHRDQRQFQYGGPPQASPTGQQQHPQHHSAPVQPNMNVPQQAPQQQPTPQQAPTPAPAPATGRRKRPAPSAAPQATTGAQTGPPTAQGPAGAQTGAPTAQGAPAQGQTQAPGQVQGQAPGQAAPTADANSATPQPPPPKKTRTNTPWTPAEELRLKHMRDAGNSWAEIAKTFPTRTEGSVKKHWYKDMHYAEFAEDESQALLNAIKEYENNKWKVIGQKVGKPAKACEQYAKEHFPGMFNQDGTFDSSGRKPRADKRRFRRSTVVETPPAVNPATPANPTNAPHPPHPPHQAHPTHPTNAVNPGNPAQ
ncbi:hypothetical protein ACRALDRAFT_2037176 [Sodiomyces alcalophilus JCM 7366]|uniref:uncharacterized protein n=1 Tax=Sodiomyces alcalophilus JCM 7366 TaxID=591952 RepID=UPI0039B415D7